MLRSKNTYYLLNYFKCLVLDLTKTKRVLNLRELMSYVQSKVIDPAIKGVHNVWFLSKVKISQESCLHHPSVLSQPKMKMNGGDQSWTRVARLPLIMYLKQK